jgi:gliding motility-associated transport system ATP-binding protein
MDGGRSEAMVEARSLQKLYGSTHAVDGISFKVSRGEVVGFLGPNGAGKSTTMKMLTGYLRPTAGQAVVGGTNVEDDPLAAKRMIGYLPENAPLYDDMMVADFLEFIADLRGIKGGTRKERLRTVCDRCGLEGVLGKNIGHLSKGYRQRVGLAQAIVHDPDLLILDEPTAGLDPNQIVEIRELIKELGREKTVILSTHILPEVQATCRRILIISNGKLVADDAPEMLAEGGGTVIRVIVKGRDGAAVDASSVRSALADVHGVRAVEPFDGEGPGTVGFRVRGTGTNDPREGIFGAAVNGNFVLLDLHRERVSLEDTFRLLTTGEGGAQ